MKTDWLRTPLLGGILIVCFLLVIRWNDFQERRDAQAEQVAIQTSSTKASDDQVTNGSTSDFDLPTQAPQSQTPEVNEIAPVSNHHKTITVKTDVLEVEIDPHGGDIVGAALLQHYKKLNRPDDPFILLERSGHHLYIARSGLVGQNGTDSASKGRPQFSSQFSQYTLDDEDALIVDLFYDQGEAQIIKRFTFNRSDYLIQVDYIIDNKSQQTWKANLAGSIKRGTYNPVKVSAFSMQPFLGVATTTNDDNYDKYTFEDIEKKRHTHTIEGGWLAMVQHYFISAWIPPKNQINKYDFRKETNGENFIFGFVTDDIVVPSGEQKTVSSGFYVGPKNIERLEEISPHLDLTIDYSFLWWIAKPLFFALDFIQDFAKNWGLSIIILTIFIKILFFWPSAVSYRSMAKMRKLQPKMQELKERVGDDRQKFSQEMMKLYRTEKVNPVSGCLPILIQMPVFMALYWVLNESVELRHTPFVLWIHDLSIRDPYFILPLIMGATMWIQQKLNPTPTDPTQAKIMQMMPIFFTFLFMWFPAGLVLYWVVNNTLSIAQQYIITKQIEAQG